MKWIFPTFYHSMLTYYQMTNNCDIVGITDSDAGTYRCLVFKNDMQQASAEKDIEIFSETPV